MRNRESRIYLELDHLLNLLFSCKSKERAWLWKTDPFATVVQSFCRDAIAVIPSKELRQHVLGNWMAQRSETLSEDAKKSLYELMDTNLPLRN